MAPAEPEPVRPKKTAAKPPKPKPALRSPPSQPPQAESIIQGLRSLNVAVSHGLSNTEITAVESNLSISFPPDLRSILRSGLPVGPHFPEWRFESTDQLRVRLNLPILGVLKNVARNGFWVGSWGPKPQNDDAARTVFKKLLEEAPILISVYGDCYIPSTTPNLAGNPLILVNSDEIRVLSSDVAGFFRRFDHFSRSASSSSSSSCSSDFDFFEDDEVDDDRESRKLLPETAAKEVRRVKFWTDAAENGRNQTARGDTCVWWRVTSDEGLRACLDGAFRTLSEGGWREDEVREMLMMDGSDDRCGAQSSSAADALLGAECSTEDAMHVRDLGQDDESNGLGGGTGIGSTESEDSASRHTDPTCSAEQDHRKQGSMKTLMQLLSQEA